MAIRLDKSGNYRAYFKYQGRLYSKTVKTKAAGKEWEAQQKKALRQEASQGPILMFSAVSALYLDDCKARVQPITLDEKYRHLTEFAEFVMSDFPADSLTVATAKTFVAKTQKERGNKSANRRLGDLQACWNWHKHALPFNPWKHVQPYPEEESTKYVPPAKDVMALLGKATRGIMGEFS